MLSVPLLSPGELVSPLVLLYLDVWLCGYVVAGTDVFFSTRTAVCSVVEADESPPRCLANFLVQYSPQLDCCLARVSFNT